jgi:hypothetical protein
MNFVVSALIEPGLSASQRRADTERGCIFLQWMEREKRAAHLDPAPDSGEKGGSIDDGGCVEHFWIVSGGQFGGLLEVVAKRPHQTKGDTAKVNN